jgi:hypothetical protein
MLMRSLPSGGLDGRKSFFFEKKKQKTFRWLSRAYSADVPQYIKVFWFFFSKKNSFSYVHHARGAPWSRR